MTVSASSGRPPPDPNPPYTFHTPPPQWTAYDFTQPTPERTHRRIIRTPHDPGTLIYVAAANKTTNETHAITEQWPTHHDNSTTPSPLISSNTNPVDNPVKSTSGSTKRRIVRTRPELGTRVYAGVYAAAHAITKQQKKHDATLEPTILLTNENYNASPESTHSFQFATTADNKPGKKTSQQLQPADHEPYSFGPTPNTFMPSWKHSALLRNIPKSTNIYTFSGYKMDISLTPNSADSGRHQQPDDKSKEETRYQIGPMTSPHIKSNRIHILDAAMTTENIKRSTQVQPADNGKHINPTVHPFPTTTTIPHKTNHSATLTMLINPHIPTVSYPQIQKRSSHQNGNLHTVTTTPANRPATLYDEIRRHHTLPNQQSRSETNIDTTNNIENDREWRGNTQTAGITTALAPTPIFTPLDGAQPTRRIKTDPSRAFQSRTDAISLSTIQAHSHNTAIVAHLQRLFYPPPKLSPITPIITHSNIVLPPTDSLRQQHQSKSHHQHRTTLTSGHKALTYASKTTTTAAAANGSKTSKKHADANTEDPKPHQHTAYDTRWPTLTNTQPTIGPTRWPYTPTLTQHSTYHRQRTAHLHPHAANLRTKKLVQNTHRIGAHISNHRKKDYCTINCYQQACYDQANFIAATQKRNKIQPLDTQQSITSKASWNKDSLKPP